jgi:hypothetical protein
MACLTYIFTYQKALIKLMTLWVKKKSWDVNHNMYSTFKSVYRLLKKLLLIALVNFD